MKHDINLIILNGEIRRNIGDAIVVDESNDLSNMNIENDNECQYTEAYYSGS